MGAFWERPDCDPDTYSREVPGLVDFLQNKATVSGFLFLRKPTAATLLSIISETGIFCRMGERKNPFNIPKDYQVFTATHFLAGAVTKQDASGTQLGREMPCVCRELRRDVRSGGAAESAAQWKR